MLLESGYEHCQTLSIAFIDLEKAFNTVDGVLVFLILQRFGCPHEFLGLLRALYSGNTAVFEWGERSIRPRKCDHES